MEAYVLTEEFDRDCNRSPQPEAPKASDSQPPFSPAAPITSSISLFPHEIDLLEARLYYFGVSFRHYSNRPGITRGGPKLVYRTSKDTWVPPTEEDFGRPREKRLCDIPEDHQLAKNPSVWDDIRNQVCGIVLLAVLCH